MSAKAIGNPAMWWAMVKTQQELDALEARIRALREERAQLQAQLKAGEIEDEFEQ